MLSGTPELVAPEAGCISTARGEVVSFPRGPEGGGGAQRVVGVVPAIFISELNFPDISQLPRHGRPRSPLTPTDRSTRVPSGSDGPVS